MTEPLTPRGDEINGHVGDGNGHRVDDAVRPWAASVSGLRTVIACLLAPMWVISLPFMLFFLPWTLPVVHKKHGFRGLLWPIRDMPAQELTLFIQERRTEFQLVGFLWVLTAVALVLTGAAFAVQVRKMERGEPIFTYIIVATAAIESFVMVFGYGVWTAMSYRPNLESPYTVQMFYDLFWTFFFISWPPFTVQMVAIAIPTLRTPIAYATVPRWVAYLFLSAGGLSVLFGLAGIMPNGIFSYDGVGMAIVFALFCIEISVVPVGTALHIFQTEIRRSGLDVPSAGVTSTLDPRRSVMPQ